MKSILELSGKHIGKRVRILSDGGELALTGVIKDFHWDVVEETYLLLERPTTQVIGVVVAIDKSSLYLDSSSKFAVIA